MLHPTDTPLVELRQMWRATVGTESIRNSGTRTTSATAGNASLAATPSRQPFTFGLCGDGVGPTSDDLLVRRVGHGGD